LGHSARYGELSMDQKFLVVKEDPDGTGFIPKLHFTAASLVPYFKDADSLIIDLNTNTYFIEGSGWFPIPADA
jgi:hypothetical protein